MKTSITFEYDHEDYYDSNRIKRVLNADGAYGALFQVGEEVFRPARKHGYSDEKIQELINKLGEDGVALVGLLETKYWEIVNEKVNMEDYE